MLDFAGCKFVPLKINNMVSIDTLYAKSDLEAKNQLLNFVMSSGRIGWFYVKKYNPSGESCIIFEIANRAGV